MHVALSINHRQALIAKISPLSLEINGNIYHTNFLLFSLKRDALKLYFCLNRKKREFINVKILTAELQCFHRETKTQPPLLAFAKKVFFSIKIDFMELF